MNIKINCKNKYYLIGVILFFLIFLLNVKNVSAAELSLKSNNEQVFVGDTVSVDVLINTEGEAVNVVEGNIVVSNGLDLIEIKDLSIANSILKQWVRNPSWSKKDGTISFIGGLPGGFQAKSASLFRIFFTAQTSGQITFLPSDIKVYANDGLATPVGTHVTPLIINVSTSDILPVKDELKTLITKDYQAPTDINIDLGQDPALFDGQKFINISASDLDSGIAYFEVKEGNRDPVKTNNSYVLQNQNNLEPIIIFAFDKAGNISKKVLSPNYSGNTNNNLLIVINLVLILGLVLSGLIMFQIIKKRKKIPKK